MNKNRYKLIFSKVKGCLVPVAECINSAISNGSSDSETTTESEAEEPPLLAQPLSSVSLWVKSTLNPVSSVMQLTWKQVSILFLTVVSAPALAETVNVEQAEAEHQKEIESRKAPELKAIDANDHYIALSQKNEQQDKYNTKLHKTEKNNVIVIDIATPNAKGISDNRFERFNIPNGAVFNNSKTEKKSQLVGYVQKNENLTGDEAKVILNQVTGSQASKIEGALEILGKQADLVIANQNGITLNGVKTINAGRFVATTSSTIDPENMMLNVTNGTVTIGVDGFAIDGLPYLDIIAKKIEQKHAITNENTGKARQSDTNITFIAGNSEYNLANHTLIEGKGVDATKGDIAISGALTGAMHGKNIRLIVTDKGAGVKHDGIILSEADFEISTQNGDIELGNTNLKADENDAKIYSEGNVTIKGGDRVVIGREIKSAKKVDIQANSATLRQNAKVSAKTANVNATSSLTLEDSSKIVASDLNVTTNSLKNEGRLHGKNVNLNAENLVNNKEIYAESQLNITTKGQEFSIFDDKDYLPGFVTKSNSLLTPGFVNKGVISSNGSAVLNLTNNTSLVTERNNFLTARDNLEINAESVEIDKDKNIQLSGNITINTNGSFLNHGILASAKELKINAQKGSIYNLDGTLGAGKSLNLTAKSSEVTFNNNEKATVGGNIVNQGKGLFHTEGNMTLTADRTIYNIGSIQSKGDISLTANELKNDVIVSGHLTYKPLNKDYTRYYRINETARHGWHNNLYELNVNVREIEKPITSIANMGSIRSEGNLTFKANRNTGKESVIYNHGLINVKGTFNADADKIVNEMKQIKLDALTHFFKVGADVTIHYKPYTRHVFFGLGDTQRNFTNFESFLDALLSKAPIIKANIYSSENFSAYKLLQQVKHSPILLQGMNTAFGANWQTLSHEQMVEKWKEFKKNPTHFTYYPEQKARILADKFEANAASIQNGEQGTQGKFDGKLTIGQYNIELPKTEFIPQITNTDNLDDNKVDLSELSNLLENPNLFIDSRIQLEKKTTEYDEEDARVINGENPDYLDPRELLNNTELLKSLLEELKDEDYIDDESFYEHHQADNRRFESLSRDLQNKLHGLFSERKEREFKKREELLEKARLEKEKSQKERTEHFKEEEKRQEADKIAKEQELAEQRKQEERTREMQKQREIEAEQKALKAKEEKRAAEEKAQREAAEKEKAEALAEKQLEEELKKVEQESLKATEEARKSLFKAIDEDRPKVETDPLYRTQLNYINQDEYTGADYFFNKVAENKAGSTKVNVLGDNYFDHQLITRTIEKKADNQLAKKYNLSNTDLVKKLMDNSSSEAKNLGLKIGEVLTKEQQANLKQDIVWYVKTTVKGKEVFVPQVYLAQSTLNDVQQLRGLGSAVINANKVDIKTENLTNTGTIAGEKVSINAQGKIQNKGSILSNEETRLVGRKGIENLARSHASKTAGSDVQRSEIKTKGHLHLETDKDANITVQASDIKAKTGFVKTGDLNLTDAYKTELNYEVYDSGPATLQASESYSEKTEKVTSVGSKVELDHLHLAVEKDVNQQGSELKTKRLTGIVQGNYNTKAGQNITHVEKEEYTSHLYGSAHASGGGTSVRYDYNSKEGGKASVNVPTSNTGAGAELGIAITHKKEQESLLTHTNSELQAESGTLHVLGNADIGGVDINTHLPNNENEASKAKQEITAVAKPNSQEKKGAVIAENKAGQATQAGLSEQDIKALMAEKDKAFFDEEARKAGQSFELSAKEIKSTKQKDEYTRKVETTTLKIGPEAEAHSAIADAVSHLAKQFVDAQNGIKQDGTVALQQVSDALNLVTGDLAGASAKGAFERTKETQTLAESGDIRTKIGGNLILSAREGSIDLKNVESAANSLTLKAKENVNIQAGEKTSDSNERLSRVKVYSGVNAGCSVMSSGCTAGASVGFEGNENFTSEHKTSFNNSLLQAQNLKIEAGGDLNLESANINADQLDLNVKGKTNITSKQDTSARTQKGFDYSASVGASLSTSTIVKPTGSLGVGFSYESETSGTVNQQAGITANRITGEINDLNLTAGYIVNKDKNSGFNVKGNVTSQNLHDHHDKDGGSVGISLGANERGTSALNLRGGRVDQKHYAATQKSTLEGVNVEQGKLSGNVEKDINKAKDVTRDDTYASTQFSFEVADIVELGQKAKNRLTTPKAGSDDAPSASFRSRPVADETDSVSVKNPIYESADAVVQTPRSKNVDSASAELVDNPLYGATPRAKATEAENNLAKSHDYEEIPAGVYNKVGDSSSDLARNRAAKTDDHVYAEIGDPTYSTIGDKNADVKRNKSAVTTEYAEAGQPRARRANDPLPGLPGQTKAKVATETSENIYAEIADSKAKRALPATPDAQAKTPSVDSTYATVEAPKERKARNANDPLPELPGQSKGKAATEVDSADHIYAEIADNSKAKRPLPDAPESKAKRPLPDAPESKAKVQVSESEGDYATINPAPKAGQAQDAEVAETLQPRSKANSVESDYETIPAADNAPTANADFRRVGNADNANSHVEPKVRSVSEENSAANVSAPKAKAEEGVDNTQAVAKSEKAEKSFLSKVKDFFTGDSNKEKKAKAKATKPAQEEAQAQVATKPNYDGLEDNLNLKNLLDLEGKRNEAFESNVLKNPEFLAEAREAAKKYIPEATIKQMGNSPEFDDILTEGARKVEKRINDAVSFKPSVEEFNDIQGLVKQLPKGDVIDDVNVKTLSITEALAETSKTIQRNPKLKEEVQGAIEEFLKSSQGKDLTVEMIEKLNHGLRPDEGADRLLYKKETLTKENAVFSSPEAAKIQLGETVDFINRAKQQGVEPSVLAGLVYQRLIAYHPFAEGNGRMARVIVNKLLLDAGYPPFTKFSPEFETQIIPQTNSTAKSATSTEVVKAFLTELGKKPLPEVAEQPRVKAAVDVENNDVASTLRPRSASTSAEGDYATIPANDVVDTPRPRSNSVAEESADVSAKTKQVEDIYATVNKSPEARAKANAKADEALAKNPIVKVQVEDDDVPPALPIRPELKDAAGINSKSKVKSEDTASSAEKTSFFGKIKQLFTGSESSKSAKAAKQEDTANAKPNYDGLEDSVNLKNLLDLEGKRNEAFETNVLKNAEFLAEAREAAKKYIPEATIKQMGNSPEFDDILTEGARKVEKRINDAVTFKPTVEEFSEIQGLVKKLPKGDVIEDVNVKTQSITEALAETSKTIQRNPKLKEEVQGAIEEFLKSSQGKDLTVEMIEKLNHGLRPDEGADRQLYKKETLTKENAVFSSPEASKIQLSETVDFINQARSQGVEPSVLAGLVYQRLIAYHPFAEGNGRMARVIVNKLLLDAGYPPFTKFNSEFETQIIPQTNTTAKSATSSEVVKEFLTELGKKGDAIQKPVAKPAEQNSVETNRTLEQAVGAAAFRRANVETEQPKAAVPTAEAKAEVSKPVSERVQQKELVEQSRGVLKQVQDQFQPLKVKHKIDDVRSSVEQYGGEVSFKYAQSKGEVYKEIVKHVETQHGVCESTCAHWIANKVSNQGDDFWNTLYEGGKKGHLKQETIDSIKKLQTEFMNSGSATQQFKLTDSWLQEQGVVPKEKKVGSASRRDEVAGTVSKTDISALTKAILDTGSDNSGVKKISINLEGGSHTVSAAVQGEKVVFFDPNFGEMTFPSHKQFESWLKGAFWEKSGYAGKKDGKRFFNVVNYELPADAEKPKAATKPVVANEQDAPSKKHGFSNPFRSKGKDNAEGPKIEHLGGSADKDAFYFPLDKIVTKGSISKDMSVNLENIKKAFNPKDKHYNSSEAKNLRAMYEQDPTMSSTRFVIGNQVIENPFKSQDLQDYIQKNRTVEPVAKQAKQEKQAKVAAKKPVVPAKPKAQAETVADPNAIYAKVNKKAKSAQVDGFYSESELKTRSDKIVDQVSRVPTTEPVYADLQFNQAKSKNTHKASSEVVYDEVKTQAKAKPKAPKKAEKPKVTPRAKQQLDSGIIPDAQLKTRSDKIVDQVSRVPTTEPVYADLQFNQAKGKNTHKASGEVVYGEVKTQAKAKPKAPKKAEKPKTAQKPKQQLDKGIIPDSQLKTRSDKIVDQVSRVPNTEPVYADLQFPKQGTAKKVTSSQETIYEEVGKKTQEEPIYQNVIRRHAK